MTASCAAAILFVLQAACSSEGSGAGTASGSAGEGTGSEPGLGVPTDSAMGGSRAGADGVCQTAQSAAELLPVYLGFAFDVSGSMGKLEDSACFDPTFKWDPVVQATTAFLADGSSEGLHASLALFPARDDRCTASTYESPEVPMMALPSGEFASVLSAYEDEVDEDGWRGGTPTLAAVEGTVRYLESVMEDDPLARYAVVLVTDGKPQDCDGVTIDDITSEVSDAAARGIATYVIGVKQPTSKDGCDANAENEELIDNMAAIATAGGTEAPFMIDTGDVAATKTAFDQAIEDIRSRSVSCTVPIPENPQGGGFDKDRTDVSLEGGSPEQGGDAERLSYDPDCADEGGWRYDDAASPSFIELCPETCQVVQVAAVAQLSVDFLCEDRPDVVK